MFGDHNKWLNQFAKMRKDINSHTPTSTAPSPALTMRGGSPALIPTAPAEKPVMKNDVTYKKIVEDKLPKSDVMKYLRARIEELKPIYDA